MKIEDILQALPSKEDLASAIGLETRSAQTPDLFAAFGIFGAGILLGAGLALLCAPKPGHEMRADIVDKVSALGGHLRAQASQSSTSPNGPSA